VACDLPLPPNPWNCFNKASRWWLTDFGLALKVIFKSGKQFPSPVRASLAGGGKAERRPFDENWLTSTACHPETPMCRPGSRDVRKERNVWISH